MSGAFEVGPSTKPIIYQEKEVTPLRFSDKMAKLTEKLQIINAEFREESEKLLLATERYKNAETLAFESYDIRSKALMLQKIQNDLDITTRKIAKLEKKLRKMTNPQ